MKSSAYLQYTKVSKKNAKKLHLHFTMIIHVKDSLGTAFRRISKESQTGC